LDRFARRFMEAAGSRCVTTRNDFPERARPGRGAGRGRRAGIGVRLRGCARSIGTGSGRAAGFHSGRSADHHPSQTGDRAGSAREAGCTQSASGVARLDHPAGDDAGTEAKVAGKAEAGPGPGADGGCGTETDAFANGNAHASAVADGNSVPAARADADTGAEPRLAARGCASRCRAGRPDRLAGAGAVRAGRAGGDRLGDCPVSSATTARYRGGGAG